MAMVFTDFTPRRFLVHWLASTSLVLMTYNPFGHSYYHWIMTPGGSIFLKALAGLALLFAQVFMLWWIIATIGRAGVIVGGVIWGLTAYEILKWMPQESPVLRQMIVLLVLATVQAIGLSWPHFRTRLTGQIEKRYLIYHGKAEKKKKKKKKKLDELRRARSAAQAAARAAAAQAAAARAAAARVAIAQTSPLQAPLGRPPPGRAIIP